MNDQHIENAAEKAYDDLSDNFELDPGDVADITSTFLTHLVSEIGNEHPSTAVLKEVISLLV